MFSVIKQIKGVKEGLPYFKHDALKTMMLVLDLDNTTMQPSKSLGGDQWFTLFLDHVVKHIGNFDMALSSVLLVYNAVQHHIKAEAVEPGIVYIIRALQDLGVPVLALTARDITILQPTLRQLKAIGIDFSKSFFNHPCTDSYAEGIIFCNGSDKGIALKAFVESSKSCSSIRHVVMLDDKEKHLEHVAKAMKKLDIQFSGLRYGYLDSKVEAFNMDEANVELAYLIDHLSHDVKEKIAGFNLIASHHVASAQASASHHANHFFHHQAEASSSSDDLISIERPRSASF